MSNEREHIPLFPLNVVLFPTSRISLHIFEEKYKVMIQQCMERESEFGINLYEKNYIHPVGCTAKVERITRKYPDGSFDITIQGNSKYRLIEYKADDDGYLVGSVEVFYDFQEQPADDLVLRAIALYNSLAEIAYSGQWEPEAFNDRRNSLTLSYVMAEKAGLELNDRQKLLELTSEPKRLEELIRHMERTIPVMREFEHVKRLVMNDGYLPRLKHDT